MPSEASVARSGICGYCCFRTALRTPVPQPLSKVVALGVSRGRRAETRLTSFWEGGVVRRSTWM